MAVQVSVSVPVPTTLPLAVTPMVTMMVLPFNVALPLVKVSV